MVKTGKQEILKQIIYLLSELMDSNDNEPSNQKTESSDTNKVELLTIHEAVELISGLSEHTLRLLVHQDKIKYIRSGQGKRGKILIFKESLIDYFKSSV